MSPTSLKWLRTKWMKKRDNDKANGVKCKQLMNRVNGIMVVTCTVFTIFLWIWNYTKNKVTKNHKNIYMANVYKSFINFYTYVSKNGNQFSEEWRFYGLINLLIAIPSWRATVHFNKEA